MGSNTSLTSDGDEFLAGMDHRVVAKFEYRVDEVVSLKRSLRHMHEEFSRAMALISARDERIAALEAELAAYRPVPVAAPNPFREFGGDRRRVGG